MRGHDCMSSWVLISRINTFCDVLLSVITNGEVDVINIHSVPLGGILSCGVRSDVGVCCLIVFPIDLIMLSLILGLSNLCWKGALGSAQGFAVDRS